MVEQRDGPVGEAALRRLAAENKRNSSEIIAARRKLLVSIVQSYITCAQFGRLYETESMLHSASHYLDEVYRDLCYQCGQMSVSGYNGEDGRYCVQCVQALRDETRRNKPRWRGITLEFLVEHDEEMKQKRMRLVRGG